MRFNEGNGKFAIESEIKNLVIEDCFLKFAVIISKSNGKWVLCKHKDRNTYDTTLIDSRIYATGRELVSKDRLRKEKYEQNRNHYIHEYVYDI